MSFGLQYGRQAQEFANALADAANAYKGVGYMLEATGSNYKNADAASTIGGGTPAAGLGGEPSKTTAGDASEGPNSSVVPPPLKWHLIQPFLRVLPGIGLFASAAMTWPSGNSAMMRVTAAQWRNLGRGLSVFDDDMAALKTAVSLQNIPEGAKINEALGNLGQALSSLSDTASTIAQGIDDFASGVQETQDAIRRLLDRLSVGGLFDTVKGFLTGDGEKILREIADDVSDVLENFQSQVKGVVGLLEELTNVIGDAATAFQKWIRPVREATFGDEVGGFLADTVTLYTDFQVGVTTGLISTVSGVVAMADIDTWKGMADLAMSVAEDPSTLPGVLENMGKEFVAWDKWSGDHPGRAAGEAAFNIGSLFVPGGAFSKTGTLAKGLKMTKGLLDEGKLGKLGDLTSLGPTTRNLDNLDDFGGFGSKGPEAPEFKPGPAIPESIINPDGRTGFETPSSQRELESPTGPPDPPSSTGTRGGHEYPGDGGGPPPDPPGRTVGPFESGPGNVDGQSPASAGPGFDSSHSAGPSAPSSGEQMSPITDHTPESPSATSPHDGVGSGSEHGQTSASHEPRTPETPGNGQVTDQRAGPSVGQDAGASGVEHQAPSQQHQPGLGDYSGRPDDRVAAPVGQQPTQVSEPPGGHDRTADGGASQEQPQTPSNGDRQDAGPAAPGVMPAAGMPTASPAAGTVHSPSDSPAARPNTPETTTRGPDGRTTQSTLPEGPRAQPPAAAGPAAATPSAPVNPVAAQSVPSSTSDSHSSFMEANDGPTSGGPPENHRQSIDSNNDRRVDAPIAPGHSGDPDAPSRPNQTQPHDDGTELEGAYVDSQSDPAEPTTNPPGDQTDWDDNRSRTYSLMDESSHTTAFAPEQLLDTQRVSEALSNHAVSRSDFVELINKPTDTLTPAERDLVNSVRDALPSPTRDTVMQKVIPPGYFDDAGNFVQSRADDYIMENNPRVVVDQMGGAVTVAGDTAHLSTPARIYDGLRLDYTDSPFERYDAGTHIIRFQADPGSSGFYDVPRNSDMGGDGSYDTWDDPFTGNAFTKSADDVIPEYIAKNITMRDGAEMWEVLEDGTQRLVAVLKDSEWIPQGN